jgi:hypothetical protein
MLVLELGSHIAGSDKKRVCCVLRFAVRNPEKDRLLAWIGCGCEGCEEGVMMSWTRQHSHRGGFVAPNKILTQNSLV